MTDASSGTGADGLGVCSSRTVSVSDLDHLPYRCAICLAMAEARGVELAAYLRKTASRCICCGFLVESNSDNNSDNNSNPSDHAPDCEWPSRHNAGI